MLGQGICSNCCCRRPSPPARNYTGSAASVIGSWVRRNMLERDGSSGGRYRVFGEAYADRDGAVVIGAHMALQYDLSYGLMPKLMEWHDLQSGGFACDLTANGEMPDQMDIPYTCGGGFAFLQLGRLEDARRVADFLKRLYDAQTELPDRFFYTWSRNRQVVITEFRAERAIAFVVENQDPTRQRWTIGGITAHFRCRRYATETAP